MAEEVLNAEAALGYYGMLNKIKPANLRPRYPFVRLDRDGLVKTLREIELTYQHATKTFVDGSRRGAPHLRRGGGGGRVTVYL